MSPITNDELSSATSGTLTSKEAKERLDFLFFKNPDFIQQFSVPEQGQMIGRLLEMSTASWLALAQEARENPDPVFLTWYIAASDPVNADRVPRPGDPVVASTIKDRSDILRLIQGQHTSDRDKIDDMIVAASLGFAVVVVAFGVGGFISTVSPWLSAGVAVPFAVGVGHILKLVRSTAEHVQDHMLEKPGDRALDKLVALSWKTIDHHRPILNFLHDIPTDCLPPKWRDIDRMNASTDQLLVEEKMRWRRLPPSILFGGLFAPNGRVSETDLDKYAPARWTLKRLWDAASAAWNIKNEDPGRFPNRGVPLDGTLGGAISPAEAAGMLMDRKHPRMSVQPVVIPLHRRAGPAHAPGPDAPESDKPGPPRRL